jgi:hypothetical protein
MIDRRIERLLDKGFFIDLDRVWMDEEQALEIGDEEKREFGFGCTLKNDGGVVVVMDVYTNETFLSCSSLRTGLVSLITGLDPDFQFDYEEEIFKEKEDGT